MQALAELVVSRQVVRDLEPRRLRGDVDVRLRPDARLVGEGAERNVYPVAVADDRPEERAADATAGVVPVVVAPDQQPVGAVDDLEPLARDPAEGLERRARAGAAARAVAVQGVLERVSDAVVHRAALATAVEDAFAHRQLRRPAPRKVIGSEVHDPLGAAVAVLVLAAALRALPVGPPDPLQVVQLQHDQRDAPEEDLRLAHRASLCAPCAYVNG